MPGTLLVYDAIFPRASAPTGPIFNTPSTEELRTNSYRSPYSLLPIPAASNSETYCEQIAEAAAEMAPLDCLILLGHGRTANAATPNGTSTVTTGIVLGSTDITVSNAENLRSSARHLSRTGRAELWVCHAAATGAAGGLSGTRLCQAIADALSVVVIAPSQLQEYSSRNQTEIASGGWQSTMQFLPFEGETHRFRPQQRSP